MPFRKMESRYKKLKHRQKHIKELIKIGVVDPCVNRNIEIYEAYHELDSCYICKCEIIADRYNVSVSTIEKVIRFMKEGS